MTTLAAPNFIDPHYLLGTFGLIGLLVVIFAECGLLIGFFMPGDTLLFTAGLLVSNNIFHQPLWLVLLLTPIAAILGNLTGYWIGRRAGPAVFDRPDSKLFRREHVDRVYAFFDRYGAATIFLARFVPVVRTFATVAAGASRMKFALFAAYSILGGIVWCIGVTVAGYYLGRIKVIRDNVDVILILGVLSAVAVSVVPLVLRYLRNRRTKAQADETAAR